MKIISKVFTLLLFILFLGFALKNTDPATLHFYLGYAFSGPLVVILLIFLVVGIILGILMTLPTLFRYRMRMKHAQKESALAQQTMHQKEDHLTHTRY